MKSLARAVVESAAFVELSDDDAIDSDAAVQAQEAIVSSLNEASAEEKMALLAYCRESAAAITSPCSPGDARRREFYLGFGASFGLIDD